MAAHASRPAKRARDSVIVLDGDQQDPPELIPALLAAQGAAPRRRRCAGHEAQPPAIRSGFAWVSPFITPWAPLRPNAYAAASGLLLPHEPRACGARQRVPGKKKNSFPFANLKRPFFLALPGSFFSPARFFLPPRVFFFFFFF